MTAHRSRAGLPALLAGALLAVPAAAQEPPKDPPARGLTGYVGGGIAIAPDFQGANEYALRPFPAAFVEWRGFYLESVDGTGFDLNLLPGASIDVGPAFNFRFQRDGDVEDSVVAQLDPIDAAIELGAFLNVNLPAVFASDDLFQVRVRWLTDVNDAHNGMRLAVGSRYNFHVGERLDLRAVFDVIWSSADYMNTYFGITAAEAARTGLPAFIAGEAFTEVDFGFEAHYRLTRRFGIAAEAQFIRLFNDADVSPITALRGTPNGVFAGIGLTYSF